MARKLVGTVVSDVQDKTIVIAVNRSVTHPVYGKRYSVTKKYAAHDEKNQAHIGDKVEVTETRPISKRKTWELSKVIETGHASEEIKDEAAGLQPKIQAKGTGKTKVAKEGETAK